MDIVDIKVVNISMTHKCYVGYSIIPMCLFFVFSQGVTASSIAGIKTFAKTHSPPACAHRRVAAVPRRPRRRPISKHIPHRGSSPTSTLAIVATLPTWRASRIWAQHVCSTSPHSCLVINESAVLPTSRYPPPTPASRIWSSISRRLLNLSVSSESKMTIDNWLCTMSHTGDLHFNTYDNAGMQMLNLGQLGLRILRSDRHNLLTAILFIKWVIFILCAFDYFYMISLCHLRNYSKWPPVRGLERSKNESE